MSTLVKRAAVSRTVPPTLMLALALIEEYCRPALFRRIESLALRTFLELYRWFATPVPNLSVGSFQIKVAVAARLMGVPVRLSGSWIELPRDSLTRRKAFRLLKDISSDEENVDLAALHIKHLVNRISVARPGPRPTACRDGNKLDPAALRIIGTLYNSGHTEDQSARFTEFPYGRVLADVVRMLEDCESTAALQNSRAGQ